MGLLHAFIRNNRLPCDLQRYILQIILNVKHSFKISDAYVRNILTFAELVPRSTFEFASEFTFYHMFHEVSSTLCASRFFVNLIFLSRQNGKKS